MSLLRVEKANGVWTVILCRPQAKNAVNRALADLLYTTFKEFDSDPTAFAAVLWGEGGTFCAGADLKDFNNRLDLEGDVGPMGCSRLQLSKPVIAAVSGYAVAGGLELALWCDLRVVEEDAIMGVFCRRWGVPLIDGGTIRLPRLIGLSRALDLMLTGRPVSAGESLSMGLANRVVKKGASREAAEELAHLIVSFPSLCMRTDRQSAYEQSSLTLSDALKNEFTLGMQSIAAGESLRGAAKFAKGSGRHGSFAEFKPSKL